MKKVYYTILIILLGVCGILPLLTTAAGTPLPGLTDNVVAGLNLLGWSAFAAFLFARLDLAQEMGEIARAMGIDTRFKSFELLFSSLIDEISRKNSALSFELVERRIASKQELSRTLERIADLSFKLLKAESAELALFDTESGLYHTAIVLGRPFRTSAQAMLSGAVEGKPDADPDVLIQPIAFAGKVLGSLRVSLKRGNVPSVGDQEIMRLLALQGSLALVNSHYTEEIISMRRASEESVKVKTGFLANLGHEIRGPLGIILNAVELVLEGLCGPLTGDQLETLEMVRKSGTHLLELINDVLDYAKIESGRLTPNRTEILVDELLQDICSVVRAQADAKSHKLIFTRSEEALAVLCDRRHLRQMLINLLTNAVKYTPDGGKIEVWAERVPGNKVKFNVRDNGIGIEKAQQCAVFAAFERVQNAYTIAQAGTGLGMCLTRKLAEVNGGSIDFNSTPREGSHFWLLFPAIVPTHPQHVADGKKKVEGRGDVILLIESDEAERSMVSRYLSFLNFRVEPAGNKSESLDILRGQNVSLAIVDNSAIEESEGEIVREIRSRNSSARIPIILLSSKAFIFNVERYLKAGVDRCLAKPVQLHDLAVVIRGLIDGDAEAVDGPASDGRAKSPGGLKASLSDDILH